MIINTENAADEYFEHNPEAQKVYFLMINEEEKEMVEDCAVIDIEMNLLTIEEKK